LHVQARQGCNCCHELSELEYTIKFLSMAAFNDASEQYTNRDNHLIDFRPKLHALVDNSDGCSRMVLAI
jgi:hypothetical protein